MGVLRGHPNGVPVRDLHVLLGTETQGKRWPLSLLLGVLLADPSPPEDSCYLVSVHRDGLVAQRRCERRAEAESVRSRFVQAVSTLGDEEYRQADFQALLDSA